MEYLSNDEDQEVLQQEVREDTSHKLGKQLPSNFASPVYLVITNLN